MDWMTILKNIFELVIFPLILAGGIYLIYLASVKITEIKQKTDNDKAKTYLDMLNNTIAKSVLATTQTYVESLKKQGKFDLDAQKIAFEQTYDAVMNVLTDEAKKYLTTLVGDLTTYVTTEIEANVKLNKVC